MAETWVYPKNGKKYLKEKAEPYICIQPPSAAHLEAQQRFILDSLTRKIELPTFQQNRHLFGTDVASAGTTSNSAIGMFHNADCLGLCQPVRTIRLVKQVESRVVEPKQLT